MGQNNFVCSASEQFVAVLGLHLFYSPCQLYQYNDLQLALSLSAISSVGLLCDLSAARVHTGQYLTDLSKVP